MSIVILPGSGAGPVSLGMTKPGVQTALGKPDDEFVRSSFSRGVEWEYRARGIFIAFDQQGRCVSIAIHEEGEPILQGVSLLRIRASEAWAVLQRLDRKAIVDNNSLVSRRLGVSIFAPHIDEDPAEPADSVMVFRPDHLGSP
jgi:hypothetical protein